MLTVPGEVVLAQVANVTLTTYRVEQEVNRWGEKNLTTITLDDLTSCHIESRSKPFRALGVGLLVAIVALVLSPMAVALVIGVLCGVVVWLLSRLKVLVLRSASEKIEVARSSLGDWQELQQFVHQIQTVKADRTTASRAASLAAVTGNVRQEPAVQMAGQQASALLRVPEEPHADGSKPLTQRAEKKAEVVPPPSPVWMGSSSFTFDVKVGSSSAATAPAQKLPEIPPESSPKEPDASAMQVHQEAGSGAQLSESKTPEASAAAPATMATPEATTGSVETKQGREVPSQNLASGPPRQPRTHSTAVLLVSVGITAVIVLALVFVALHWFPSSPRNESQAVPSQSPRNRELRATEVLNLAAPAIVSIESFDNAGVQRASGIGFVAAGSTVITNYRVIRGTSTAKVRFQNGDTAEVLGVLSHDVGLNVAVLRVSGGSANSVPLGDSGQLQIGNRVFVVCGRDSQAAVSAGQVTGILGNGLIQTTIPLGSALSACPLLSAQGEIVGIAAGPPNRSVAVPISWAKNYIANTEVSALQEISARNTVTQPLIRSTFSVPARQRQSWSFVVDGDRMANPQLVGSFSSTGGLGGQIQFLLITGDNQELYDSGRTTGEAVRVSLPAGKCMLVFDNSASLVFPRSVNADFSLQYVK